MKEETEQSIETFQILFFITLIEISLTWMLNGMDTFWSLKLALNAIIGDAAVMLLITQNVALKEKMEIQKETKWLTAIGYLISFFWIILSVRGNVYELWMFGSIWIAFLVSPYPAMGYHTVFSYLYAILNQLSVEKFGLYVILGWIMCGLTDSMKKKRKMPAAIVIAIISHIAVMLFANQFQFSTSTGHEMLYAMLSFLAELMLVMAVCFIKEKRDGLEHKKASEEEIKSNEKSKKARYKMLLNIHFPLIRKIEERSKYLYKHSLRVAVASGEAAKMIGADELAAQVGGLYHDIGKIEDGDERENGQKLALEYGLPKEVQVIIESHNVKYNKPKTIEAAIVMFADSIITSMEVLQTRHGDLTKNRQAIIQKIFEVRLEDGTLDESGLNFSQYRTLMKYFEEHDI